MPNQPSELAAAVQRAVVPARARPPESGSEPLPRTSPGAKRQVASSQSGKAAAEPGVRAKGPGGPAGNGLGDYESAPQVHASKDDCRIGVMKSCSVPEICCAEAIRTAAKVLRRRSGVVVIGPFRCVMVLRPLLGVVEEPPFFGIMGARTRNTKPIPNRRPRPHGPGDSLESITDGQGSATMQTGNREW